MTSHWPASSDFLSDNDIRLFSAGRHHRLYDKLGARLGKQDEPDGVYFVVWAPNADRVSVFGDFNAWRRDANPLQLRTSSGIWEGFVPGAGDGTVYKFHIVSRSNGYAADKADPLGFQHQEAPQTASVVLDLGYAWGDADWMQSRSVHNSLSSPISVYEVHLGSWARVSNEGNRFLSYLEMAESAGTLREETRIHARAISPANGTPVLRVVGLPDDRVLCTYETLWFSGRAYVFDRRVSPSWDRRVSGLGPVAFSERRACVGAHGRRPSLRACRSP